MAILLIFGIFSGIVLAEITTSVIFALKAPIYTNINFSDSYQKNIYNLVQALPGEIVTKKSLEINDPLVWHLPHHSWFSFGDFAGQKTEFLIRSTWNNFGCNDSIDYDELNKRNAPSILFLGDSFVESRQVPQEKSFYSRLRDSILGHKFNIMGCGCSGWSPYYATGALMGTPRATPSGYYLCPMKPTIERLKPEKLFYIVFLGNDYMDEVPNDFLDYKKSVSCHKNLNTEGSSLTIFKVYNQLSNILFPRLESDQENCCPPIFLALFKLKKLGCY